MRVLLMVLGLALAAPAMTTGALAQQQAAAPAEGRIVVQGEGRVSRTPDMATISLGVIAEDRTAAAAMAANSAQMRAVMDQLAAAGIAPADIRTAQVSLHPNWTHDRTDGGPGRITGFTATNQVEIRVRDLGRMGAVLDAVTQAGANSVGGIRFGLQDMATPVDEARRAAVADALRKARLYAEAAGVTLGRVLELSEAGGFQPEPRMFASMARESADVPISEGEMDVSASVSMVFALAQ
jgi:uncharacterized protein YggE